MTNEEAIDELSVIGERLSHPENCEQGVYSFRDGDYLEALDLAIKALEIELLTDTEQRIFLKAMSREREVCQRADDEYSDDDSKVSLVRVCNSIERKVKKIWE